MPENEVAGYQGPDYNEIQQHEPPPELPTVPVDVMGPVNTRELPAVDAQIVTRTIAAGETVKLVAPNEFRQRITISSDWVYYLARTKGEADALVGRLPADQPIVLHAPVEYWAHNNSGDNIMVTLILESWAR